MQILLVGDVKSEKSTAADIIVGKRLYYKQQKLSHHVIRQGFVAGRNITVVEAPAWLSHEPVEESDEVLQLEIVQSVSLCTPGPDAILLVVNGGSILTEKSKAVIEGYMMLFGENVWNHTLVLITHEGFLEDTAIKQSIHSKENALHELIMKCENRYHIFNIKQKDEFSQVTVLLGMIEEIVARNGDCFLQLHTKISDPIKEKLALLYEEMPQMSLQDSLKNKLLDMRLLLVGNVSSRQHSVGDIILGVKGNFKRRNFVKVGFREQRKITVVEAWWNLQCAVESDSVLKQEIVQRVAYCPPGPHAILLVINWGFKLTEERNATLQSYLMPLGEKVWNHTLVLIVCDGYLEYTTVKKIIELNENALHQLIIKCGNRYHIFDNKQKDNFSQVTELLEKIEEMVAHNGGCHFQLDTKISGKMKLTNQEEGRVQEHPVTASKTHLPVMQILLMGNLKSEKTLAGNIILGRKKTFMPLNCVKKENIVSGRRITLVEAPAWTDHQPVQRSSVFFQQELVRSVSLCPPGPHAVLLVVNGNFMSRKNKRIVEGYMNLLGKKVWNHTLVLITNVGHFGDTPIKQFIHFSSSLQQLIAKCGSRYHIFNNKSKDRSQVTKLLEKIEEMVAHNGGHHFQLHMTISQKCTTGKELPTEKLEKDIEDCTPYRFLISHEGQLQCRLTNIVFEMEEKAEVCYTISSWDSRLLDGLDGRMLPAGPLYSINCINGSISYLHFPHCEIDSSENKAALSVARFTEGNVEIIPPFKISNTHVIIKVQGLSLFGLLKGLLFHMPPIRAQVLLFYNKREQKLNIHLLPANVPVNEVRKQHNSNTYIETSSKCQLTPGKEYRVHCEPFTSQPTAEIFDPDYGPNYHITFEVHLNSEPAQVTISLMNEEDDEVWEPRIVSLRGYSTETAQHKSGSARAEFVDKHRDKIIQGVPTVEDIADCLLSKDLITEGLYNKINSERPAESQMRMLYSAFNTEIVKVEFYEILKVKYLPLIEELESK